VPNTQVRVVGSGFTTFNYRGNPIAFLDGFQDSGQGPIVNPEPITPLNARYPVEIATARVLDMGTLTVTIRELWNAPVWYQLVGLNGLNDIVQVYEALAAEPSDVTAQMIIKPPGAPTWRGKTYHGCIITGIDDTETVTIGALSMPRRLQVAYTHTTPLVQPAA
jgi:hypothetical protein